MKRSFAGALGVFVGVIAWAGTRDDPTPKGWIEVDAGKSFSVRAPPGSKLTPLQGIDSFVGKIEGPEFAIDFDYGQFSGDHSSLLKTAEYRSSREVSVESVLVDGRSAQVTSGPGVWRCKARFVGIHFPTVHGATRLSMSACVDAKHVSTIERIFRSIRFPGKLPVATPVPATGDPCGAMIADGFLHGSARCYRDLAIARKDPTPCESSGEFRPECLIEIARLLGEPSDCDRVFAELPTSGPGAGARPANQANLDDCHQYVTGVDHYRTALALLERDRSAAVEECEKLRAPGHRSSCLTWLSDRLAGVDGVTREAYEAATRLSKPKKEWVSTCTSNPSPAEWTLCVRGFTVEHLSTTKALLGPFRSNVTASAERTRIFCEGPPPGRPSVRDLFDALCPKETPKWEPFLSPPWPPR